MWAKYVDRPRHVAGIDVEPPDPATLADGEVLLRFLVGGLCGSDGPRWRGHTHPFTPGPGPHPGTPMHEIVGEVVATRSRLHQVGDRVVGWADRFDGLQEYLATGEEAVLAYDESLTPVQALMLQPLACVIYAVEQMGPVAGRDAAILGLGPIGVLFAHVLKHAGAASVTGVDVVDRSDVADYYGVDRFEHHSTSSWAASLTASSRRPDLVVEAIGHQVGSLTHAVEAVRDGGFIFYFGIPDDLVYPLPMGLMLRKQLTLKAGTTVERRRALAAADAYVREHPDLPGRYITGVYRPEEADAAYRAAYTPAPGQLKIVISAVPR
ncbi:zinc-binding dehydrogenase [Cumulibacter manganitolerans]|uniref:zinc-binding dehydrogenase n=1 Tax=Cumulibacter manganitolerans TaxID=1884992 RepID=UPI001295215F|nr:zinc-binding dehydrogenase [Cumulibacter manganitolerans]